MDYNIAFPKCKTNGFPSLLRNVWVAIYAVDILRPAEIRHLSMMTTTSYLFNFYMTIMYRTEL